MLQGEKLQISLSTLDMVDVVCWYGDLATTLLPLNISLLPFDSIEIGMGDTGLFPPGVGTT
jgi:hypothetical protein